MGALDKFKALFFGAPTKKKTPPKKKKTPKKTHLKIVKEEKGPSSVAQKNDVQILQKQIAQKIASNPEEAKKAALIIEKMLQKK